ncbi:MAG: DUF1573 domain-containing protein [Chitinophagaceae bacterium]|nr:DUF1573 domain-containing protein [Chitinophagaceae bacterium]
MKQKFIPLFLAFFTVFVACKNPNPTFKLSEFSAKDSAKFTKIQWIDSIIDFGTIKMGEAKRVTFRLKNIGDKPLYITNVRAGCSCTVPDYTKEAIPPGGEGFVLGEFDSNKAHPGEVRKSIFVTTNTENGVNKTLLFNGIIEDNRSPSVTPGTPIKPPVKN